MITQRTENDIPGGCMMAFIAVLLICGLIVIMGCTKSSVSPDYTPDGLTLIAQPPNQSPNLKSAAPNRMPNGGGDGAADWYDEDGNGMADMWTGYPPLPGWAGQNYTAGDVTQWVTSPNQFILISPTPPVKNSIHNTLTFCYRSTTPVTVVCRLNSRCGYIIARLPAYMAISGWKSVSVPFTAYAVHSIMWYNSPTQPGVLEVDKVNLY